MNALLNFTEFLICESPNGHIGDWEATEMKLVSKIVPSSFINRLTLLDNINDISYYIKQDKSVAYAIIKNNTIILELKLSNFDISVSKEEGLQTNMVKVDTDYVKFGVAKTLYKLLIEKYNTIICDRDQYDGARALWKSLAKENYHLYIYDEVKDTLTKVINFNNEKAIWSFTDYSKENILLVVSSKNLNTNPKY